MFYQPAYEARIFKALQERAILLTKCKEDAKLRACVFEKCKEDPVYFIETFLFTAKNTVFFSEKVPNDVPFLLFDFQKDVLDEMIECITTGKNLFIEKSRQMGITWLIMAVFLWGFIFKGWRVHIISQKEEYVDKLGDIQSCFERLRYFLRMTPDFLLPDGFNKEVSGPNVKFRAIVAPDGISSITGESANPNAGTGGTYTCIFMDEMAKQDHAKSINTACAAATQCRIFNSTPYGGEGTEYYSMRKLAMQKKIKGVSLLWSLNPFYTKEWYEWKTNGMTEEQIQQELEINYTVSVIGRVYKKFQNVPNGDVHIGIFPYDHTLPLYVALDNAHTDLADPHAIVVAQKDNMGRIRIIDCCQSQLDITQTAHFLAKRPLPGQMDEKMLKFYERWEKYKSAIFIGDPHDTMTKWNNTSIYEEYRKAGIYLTRPTVTDTADIVSEQINQTTLALKRIDVNQATCEDFISALQNAKYPDRAENSQSTSENKKPVHNWTSHYRTALEYLVLYLNQMDDSDPQGFAKETYVEVGDPITGEKTLKRIAL
jgi:hypothetical protein